MYNSRYRQSEHMGPNTLYHHHELMPHQHPYNGYPVPPGRNSYNPSSYHEGCGELYGNPHYGYGKKMQSIKSSYNSPPDSTFSGEAHSAENLHSSSMRDVQNVSASAQDRDSDNMSFDSDLFKEIFISKDRGPLDGPLDSIHDSVNED